MTPEYTDAGQRGPLDPAFQWIAVVILQAGFEEIQVVVIRNRLDHDKVAGDFNRIIPTGTIREQRQIAELQVIHNRNVRAVKAQPRRDAERSPKFLDCVAVVLVVPHKC